MFKLKELLVLLKRLLLSSASIFCTETQATLCTTAECNYYVQAHIRFSQAFHGTTLTCITCVDVLYDEMLLLYVYNINAKESLMLSVLTGHCSIITVEELYSNASWYERELAEFFGVRISCARDSRTLLLTYNSTSNPLKKKAAVSANTSGFSRGISALHWFKL